MEKNISTLVGCLNNIDYTKHFYETFRMIYPTEELVFVSYGSNDGTHEWLQDLFMKDKNVIGYFNNERKTFSDTYNKCAELATKDFVVFAHNDMVVVPGWLENIEKYLHKDRVISYTTIEPPIFSDHERPGKIIKDFGDDLNNFRLKDLYSFSKGTALHYKNTTGDGVSFFMALSKEVMLKIGGFDNKFNPYFCEDDDFIRRLKLLDLKLLTSLDSLCYHFVSKTSRFSEEAKSKTAEIERNSNRTYLRKWGSYDSNNLFNIGFNIKNADYNIIYHLEPWCSVLYNDYLDYEKYIENEQKNTWFNLRNKNLGIEEFESTTDIIVEFDAKQLNQQRFEFLQNIQNILEQVTEVGEYEFDIFKIKVKRINNYIKNLIFI